MSEILDTSRFSRWLGAGLALLTAWCMISLLEIDGVSDFFSSTEDGEVIVSPASIDLGEGEPSQTRRMTFRIINKSRQTARIIGFNSDCSCVTVDGLPVDIPGGEDAEIDAMVYYPGVTSPFSHRILFYSDRPSCPTISSVIWGRSVETSNQVRIPVK